MLYQTELNWIHSQIIKKVLYGKNYIFLKIKPYYLMLEDWKKKNLLILFLQHFLILPKKIRMLFWCLSVKGVKKIVYKIRQSTYILILKFILQEQYLLPICQISMRMLIYFSLLQKQKRKEWWFM